MKVTGPKDTIKRARELRQAMSKPERLLWWALRGKQAGFRFRRQHPAGPYVLDFYCDAIRLCVEVDGESHDLRTSQDRRRDEWLARRGVVTLRVPAQEVLENLEAVVALIAQAAERRAGSHDSGPPPTLRAASP